MTKDELDLILERCVLYAKAKAMFTTPIDTGNMRYEALKVERLDSCKFRVYFHIDGKHEQGKRDGIAPYTPFTNECPVCCQGWYDNKFVPRFIEALGEALEKVNFDIIEHGEVKEKK